jgi:hypothetical protein
LLDVDRLDGMSLNLEEDEEATGDDGGRVMATKD